MVNKVKLGLNNLYLFENNNGDYLLLDTGLACKEDLILNKIKSLNMSLTVRLFSLLKLYTILKTTQ